ncbi:hypothetical protein [Acidiphilium sp.]|uniref:hypothetical protein n=1 Tax=Acidiphilium sp. TaxID=527 RepID=UPI002BE40DDE|nr:hypothetical protein [Acidiphilium sp.]HQT62754.1 hypothetical protein [Acidiphilium sp.]
MGASISQPGAASVVRDVLEQAIWKGSGMIEIEKNVPMPMRRQRYPWRQMKVGDSFVVPGKTSGAFSGAKRAAAKATGFKFATRNVEGGVRVWRVA